MGLQRRGSAVTTQDQLDLLLDGGAPPEGAAEAKGLNPTVNIRTWNNQALGVNFVQSNQHAILHRANHQHQEPIGGDRPGEVSAQRTLGSTIRQLAGYKRPGVGTSYRVRFVLDNCA